MEVSLHAIVFLAVVVQNTHSVGVKTLGIKGETIIYNKRSIYLKKNQSLVEFRLVTNHFEPEGSYMVIQTAPTYLNTTSVFLQPFVIYYYKLY